MKEKLWTKDIAAIFFLTIMPMIGAFAFGYGIGIGDIYFVPAVENWQPIELKNITPDEFVGIASECYDRFVESDYNITIEDAWIEQMDKYYSFKNSR